MMPRYFLILALILFVLTCSSSLAGEPDPYLAAKADEYQAFLEQWHTGGLGGLTAGVRFTDETRTAVDCVQHQGDSAIWTGMYLASQALRLGESEVVIAGGMDSMSTIPYLLKGTRWDGFKMGPKTIEDGWSDSVDPITGQGMGDTAENLVEKYDLSREELDAFAAGSHHKAAAAQQAGLFDAEIAPVEVPARGRKNPGFTFSADETIRHTISVEKMAKLPAVFRKGGACTAGNACGMSDGGCALVVTTRQKAAELGATPLFSLVSFAQCAAPNETMGEGPGLSIPIALSNAGMTLADMDLYEVNEAFAAQVLANERVLEWDRSKLNVHGGAIALGHPTGISGARIMLTGYHALKARGGEHLVASICGGGGVTTAMVIRREY